MSLVLAQEYCAIYARLSKEDLEKGEDYSQSILNQINILKDYAAKHGLIVYEVYADDDMSGAYNDRPGFLKMLLDAQSGICFKTIIAKNQARFTRNMADVESILHEKLPEWGVRFIGVLDHVDTNDKSNKKARQIFGLTNEWYLEDLSDNIRAVFDMKRKNGYYIGSFAPYGYDKDPDRHGHLVIDEEAADVVRRIFDMYINGYSTQKIPQILNDEGIPSPSKYKKSKYKNFYSRSTHGLWMKDSIRKMLSNQIYIGNMVQGYQRKQSYKSRKTIYLPPEERIIVENTHEPIVTREVFYTAQNIRQGNRRRMSGDGTPHVFAGKVKCVDCGASMAKRQFSIDEKTQLRCRNAAMGKNTCTPHYIKFMELEEKVTNEVRSIIERYANINDIINDIEEERMLDSRLKLIKKQLKQFDFEIDSKREMLKALYIDKTDGIIDDDQFKMLTASFKNDLDDMSNRKKTVKSEYEELQNLKKSQGNEEDLLKQYANFDKLTHEMVQRLIGYIEVGEKNEETGEQEVKIHWLF